MRLSTVGILQFIAPSLVFALALLVYDEALTGAHIVCFAAIWTAVGVALTAVFSKLLFDEPLTIVMGLGIALIISGVVLLELGGPH